MYGLKMMENNCIVMEEMMTVRITTVYNYRPIIPTLTNNYDSE